MDTFKDKVQLDEIVARRKPAVAGLELNDWSPSSSRSDIVTAAPAVLLTVSGRVDPGSERALVDAGRSPRADYFELAGAVGAEVVDFNRQSRSSEESAAPSTIEIA